MEEEFYSIIKLVSGEEIFALVSVDENDENPILVLQNPVVISTVNTPGGSMIKVKPWLNLTEESMFMIRLDKVITMIESKDQKLIDVYNNYNEDIDEDASLDGSVMPTSKMGYLSSVKDARKDLEDLFKKDIKDT
ncbi:MAG: hypothetical protein CM15mV59_1010 [Caudoviricetes sp.]|nr:MAG: hypothetical protein CM15mV59_1010 [Caudoviricetes sp.]